MKRIKLKRKLKGFLTLIIVAATATIIIPFTTSPNVAEGRWACQPQNVINCGVNDKTDLINQVNNGDGVHTDIKAIFQGLGITTQDINNQNTIGGVVTRDGRVITSSGQTVASNIVMGFRPIPGLSGTSFDGLTWNSAPNLLGPNDPQESAFIFMSNGQFQWAILMTCGNPVLKNLAPIPPHITITKEVRNMTQSPNSTTFSKSVNANAGDEVVFRVKILNNGTITDEGVRIGDILPQSLTLVPNTGQLSTQQLVNNQWKLVTVSITDAEISSKSVGNLIPNQDAFLTLHAKVTGTLSPGCSLLVNKGFTETNVISRIFDTATVNVCIAVPPPPPPPPQPVQPVQPQPVQAAAVVAQPQAVKALPVSGPVEAAGGVMGTGALGYAGYMWRKSRKRLLEALKNKKTK